MGVLRQLLLGKGADREGVDVAAQHPGGVRHGLSAAHLADLGIEVDGLAAQAGHGHAETHPGAGGGLAEDQAQHFPAEVHAGAAGLQVRRQLEQGSGLLRRDISRREEVASAEAGEGGIAAEGSHGPVFKEPLSEMTGPRVNPLGLKRSLERPRA